MSTILILACNRCRGLLLAKAEQKTRTCPYCGATVTVSKARNVATAQNAMEASKILRELKSNAAGRSR